MLLCGTSVVVLERVVTISGYMSINRYKKNDDSFVQADSRKKTQMYYPANVHAVF